MYRKELNVKWIVNVNGLFCISSFSQSCPLAENRCTQGSIHNSLDNVRSQSSGQCTN